MIKLLHQDVQKGAPTKIIPIGDKELADIEIRGATSLNLGINRKILLVEDIPIIQKVHKRILQKLGYEVDVAVNGIEALSMFSNVYAIILMDIGLPDIHGIEVARQIRQLATGSSIPIIALTAFLKDEVLDECQAAGINDVITKPITQAELQVILKRYW